GDLVVNSVVIIGTNARGEVFQESVAAPPTGMTITSLTAPAVSHPFRTIIQVVVNTTNAEAGVDSIEIGIGANFGLSGTMVGNNNAFHVLAVGATAAANPEGATIIAPASLTTGFADTHDFPTTSQQFIAFTGNPPDGVNDYIVQIGVATPTVTLDARSDEHTISQSGNQRATMSFAVTGGVGPYNYTFGELIAPTTGGTFAPTSPQNGINGDAGTVWTPPMPTAAPESFLFGITVTDTVTGATAFDFIWVIVTT
ncbi:MAG: hypothetical protein IH986_04705, partial [Planctomycetes bacterium]|nr:hypothetical protein [Planctomycetota bacterium]